MIALAEIVILPNKALPEVKLLVEKGYILLPIPLDYIPLLESGEVVKVQSITQVNSEVRLELGAELLDKGIARVNRLRA